MKEAQALRELARLAGVQTAYYDVSQQRRQAGTESLLQALQQLELPVRSPGDAPEALRAERERISGEVCPPVHAVRHGKPGAVPLRLNGNRVRKLECRLTEEGGETRHWTVRPDELNVVEQTDHGDGAQKILRLTLPAPLPHGYHRLEIEAGKTCHQSLLLSAPRKAFQDPAKLWGIFVPPYALDSEASWGAGTFSDLEAVADWMRALGGRVLATLPMLAAFLDEPFDPSPYAPASRLFWNEFYVDLQRVPELEECRKAKALAESSGVRAEVSALRSARQVDYRRLLRLKRGVLELLAAHFFSRPSERRTAFDAYVREHPAVVDYAEFRAVLDRRKVSWKEWPDPQRAGLLRSCDYDRHAKQYHLYTQWLAQVQVDALGRKLGDAGTRLYLDLPLGAHGDGYDVWRHHDLFMLGMSAGAPPDSVFTTGQTWGFPPVHPRRMREQRYAHFIAVVRHHMRSARILRIDHVMALHRLFCIPAEGPARDGVYIRYPAGDLYAILAIESHKHAAMIVGENLGTVPAYVDRSIAAHGLHGMYVLQYELAPSRSHAFPPVPKNAVASINTHDMPPFAAYWRGFDIAQRQKQGLLDRAGAARERKARAELRASVRSFLAERHAKPRGNGMRAILEACLVFLSKSPARVALVSLEDLWLETKPQNIPGTASETSEIPNWQRKMRYPHEHFSRMRSVLTCLERVDALRRKGEHADG